MLRVMRLNSFKIATVLLSVLFFYDIFFVFVTPLFTANGESVMVDVATGGMGGGKDGKGSGEALPMVIKVGEAVDVEGHKPANNSVFCVWARYPYSY